MFLLLAFSALGLVGCLGMTWLFPLLAGALWRARTSDLARSAVSGSDEAGETIVILVPAHNEQDLLPRSLSGIRKAIEIAKKTEPRLDVRVMVGADGCSDGTVSAALAGGAEVVESAECLGKWGMLNKLVESAPPCDWIVFSDCGAIWPEDLLLRSLPRMRDRGVMGIAPSYGNPEGGLLERVHWSIERHFKSLESSAGGPVSIHGATVMYRAAELKTVLARLSGRSWLNDDVVVPMLLRAQNPGKRIDYATDILVSDREKGSSSSGAARELVRRRRMVIGNVQWVREILPALWKENPLAGLIAMRRLFRIFWAYWLGLVLLTGTAILAGSPAISLGILASSVALCAVLSYRMVAPIRRILDSAFASLVAPYYCFASAFRIEGAAWK